MEAIPELSLIVVASQVGRVALCTVTRPLLPKHHSDEEERLKHLAFARPDLVALMNSTTSSEPMSEKNRDYGGEFAEVRSGQDESPHSQKHLRCENTPGMYYVFPFPILISPSGLPNGRVEARNALCTI